MAENQHVPDAKAGKRGKRKLDGSKLGAAADREIGEALGIVRPRAAGHRDGPQREPFELREVEVAHGLTIGCRLAG